jgi:hypothetical protein
MIGLSIPLLNSSMLGGSDRLEPIRRVSRTVLPQPADAWRLVAFTAEALSARGQVRARRNALQSLQELAELREAAQGPAGMLRDYEHRAMSSPR